MTAQQPSEGMQANSNLPRAVLMDLKIHLLARRPQAVGMEVTGRHTGEQVAVPRTIGDGCRGATALPVTAQRARDKAGVGVVARVVAAAILANVGGGVNERTAESCGVQARAGKVRGVSTERLPIGAELVGTSQERDTNRGRPVIDSDASRPRSGEIRGLESR